MTILHRVARICQPTISVVAGTVNLVAVDMAKAVYYQVDREHFQRWRRELGDGPTESGE